MSVATVRYCATQLLQYSAAYSAPVVHCLRHGSIYVSTWKVPYQLNRPEKHVPVGKKVPKVAYDVFYRKTPAQAYGIQGNTHVIADKGRIAERGPIRMQLKKDLIYNWCACGYSNMQPFCDGSHNRPDGEGPSTRLKPVPFIPQQDMEVWFCQCKQTSKRPFCDGSHRHLPPPKPVDDLIPPLKIKKKK